MKTVKRIIFVMTSLCLLATCDLAQEDEVYEEEPTALQSSAEKTKSSQTFAFKARFSSLVLEGYPRPDPQCVPPHFLLFVQEGKGLGLHLGKFTFSTSFCFDPVTNEYVQANAVFKAANGDELYTTGSGQLVPTSNPNYDLELSDPIQIVGGTGRFEDASGAGTAYGLVLLQQQKVDHVWTAIFSLTRNDNRKYDDN